MQAICIDGRHDNLGVDIFLPEGTPLEVYQSDKYHDSYRVVGYETYNGLRLHWKKRRFVPLSTIDETELLEQRQEQLTNA